MNKKLGILAAACAIVLGSAWYMIAQREEGRSGRRSEQGERGGRSGRSWHRYRRKGAGDWNVTWEKNPAFQQKALVSVKEGRIDVENPKAQDRYDQILKELQRKFNGRCSFRMRRRLLAKAIERKDWIAAQAIIDSIDAELVQVYDNNVVALQEILNKAAEVAVVQEPAVGGKRQQADKAAASIESPAQAEQRRARMRKILEEAEAKEASAPAEPEGEIPPPPADEEVVVIQVEPSAPEWGPAEEALYGAEALRAGVREELE